MDTSLSASEHYSEFDDLLNWTTQELIVERCKLASWMADTFNEMQYQQKWIEVYDLNVTYFILCWRWQDALDTEIMRREVSSAEHRML